MKTRYALFGLLALVLAGCSGGGSDDFKGEVAGIIFDETGLPVRDAHVYFDGNSTSKKETQSNSNGVFLLTDIPTGDQIIRVEVTQNGTRYFGSNVARIDRGTRTSNLNIAIYRDDRLASIGGWVFDRSGFKLKGAKVFVKQVAENTVLSSSYGITDDDGHYVVGALRSNMQYNVQVNGLDYNSDFDSFTLSDGETRRLDFTLPGAEDITLPKPTNVVVTAWTSPNTSRDKLPNEVLQNIKHIIKPKLKPQATSRSTSGGNFIEIDTTWDPIFDNALLGFGVYRASGGGAFQDVAFVRDPLSEIFADLDDNLREGQPYTYRVTTISTNGNESVPSNSGTATPLGDMQLLNVTGGNRPTFRWQTTPGADQYFIYIFNRYPSINVTQLWDNETDPAFGTSYTYTGSTLGIGDYYYLIVGASNDGNYSVSQVGLFRV